MRPRFRQAKGLHRNAASPESVQPRPSPDRSGSNRDRFHPRFEVSDKEALSNPISFHCDVPAVLWGQKGWQAERSGPDPDDKRLCRGGFSDSATSAFRAFLYADHPSATLVLPFPSECDWYHRDSQPSENLSPLSSHPVLPSQPGRPRKKGGRHRESTSGGYWIEACTHLPSPPGLPILPVLPRGYRDRG